MGSTAEIPLRSPVAASRSPLAWAGSVAFLSASVASIYGVCELHSRLGLAPSTDLLLMSLPKLEATSLLTAWYYAFQLAALAVVAKFERGRLPYYFCMLGLLLSVRSVFILLTPVGPPQGIVPLYPGGALAVTDHELFFSGHAGLPFLYGLVCRRPSAARTAFFAVSAVMAAVVLLTRNHYAIDVLAAYPITYAVHDAGRRLFGRLDAPA